MTEKYRRQRQVPWHLPKTATEMAINQEAYAAQCALLQHKIEEALVRPLVQVMARKCLEHWAVAEAMASGAMAGEFDPGELRCEPITFRFEG
jgi:hypothetical protein